MGRPELQWSDVGGEDPRRVTGGARGGSAAGRLRLLELVIRSAQVLWKCSRGQLGTRVDGGERIGRAAQLTVDRLGRDSGELGPGLRGRRVRAGALAWARASGSAGRTGPSGAGQAGERAGQGEPAGPGEGGSKWAAGKKGSGLGWMAGFGVWVLFPFLFLNFSIPNSNKV